MDENDEIDEILVIKRRTSVLKKYTKKISSGCCSKSSTEKEDFDLCSKIDRYGCINSEEISQEFDHKEMKQKKDEINRTDYWLEVLKDFKGSKETKKFRNEIFKGIPDRVRGAVWLKSLKVEETMSKNCHVYQKVLQIAYETSSEVLQIDLDINRCFRDFDYFHERYNIKQQQLFNVLIAYSIFNKELGYCQGMTSVAGILLMYLDEEETFWALNHLMTDKKFSMHGMFVKGFPKLLRFLAHQDKVLSKLLPYLKKHFDEICLEPTMYALKWFMTVFLERIPFSLCLRVWDIFLHEGEPILTAMVFTILKLHYKELIKLDNMGDIMNYLQEKICENFGYSDDFVMKKLISSFDELRRKKILFPPPAEQHELPKNKLGSEIDPMIDDMLETLSDYSIGLSFEMIEFKDIEEIDISSFNKSESETFCKPDSEEIELTLFSMNEEIHKLKETQLTVPKCEEKHNDEKDAAKRCDTHAFIRILESLGSMFIR